MYTTTNTGWKWRPSGLLAVAIAWLVLLVGPAQGQPASWQQAGRYGSRLAGQSGDCTGFGGR